MSSNFEEMLAVGGKSNSLGLASEVVGLVLKNKSQLAELYNCLFNEDAWVRMRAADALEKICREHPDWLQPYIDRFAVELAPSNQPSIQWHLAQIYRQVDLSNKQKNFAINWLKNLLSTPNADWIVASNAMDTLVQFTKNGSFPRDEMIQLLKIQKQHKSNAVKKHVQKLLSANYPRTRECCHKSQEKDHRLY